MRSLRLNAGVIFFLALGISYSQTSTLPNEQILDLGDGWYKTTAWVLLHDDMTMGNAREKATAKALKNIVELRFKYISSKLMLVVDLLPSKQTT